MNRFIIDLETKDVPNTSRRLRRLKSIALVENWGVYTSLPEYSQLYVETEWSEGQLDDWLYRTKGVGYVGVVAVIADDD